MSTLLVISVGQTDVQLVRDGMRHELDKRSCAALHHELECRAGDWGVTDPPTKKADHKLTELPEGRFDLCTPKLDAVLQTTGHDQDLAVLILETRRDRVRWPQDPQLAGAVLERRIQERGCERVRRVAFLTGTERLEGTGDRDAVLRQDVVRRIDAGVREAIESQRPDRIIVATTGGFPRVAPLIDEVVRLYAGPIDVDLVEVPDGAKASDATEDRAVSRCWLPEPAESYRARRHALELIERGNLLGAWGAVRHLHDDEVERRWTQVVQWLSRFAASLPLPDECDLTLLKHERTAVQVALRVELALRAGDVSRAVHGTVAFFEAALWDHLGPRVQRHPRKRIYRVEPAPDERVLRQTATTPLSKTKQEDNRKMPFEFVEESDGTCWYRIFDDNVGSIRLAGRYLGRPQLKTLAQAVSKVRDLRNDVAHNSPTPELMAMARERMENAGLWAKSPGSSWFLGQPVIAAEMEDYGLEEPGRLCADLIAEVRTRLLAATG